jgi:hypothetical protein
MKVIMFLVVWVLLVILFFVLATAHAAPIILEAENGERFQIEDIHGVDNRWRGGDSPFAAATVTDENGRSETLVFTCDGYYADARGTNYLYIPPRSVLARVSKIACREIGR